MGVEAGDLKGTPAEPSRAGGVPRVAPLVPGLVLLPARPLPLGLVAYGVAAVHVEVGLFGG